MSRATTSLLASALAFGVYVSQPFPVALTSVVAWCVGAALVGGLWVAAFYSWLRARESK